MRNHLCALALSFCAFTLFPIPAQAQNTNIAELGVVFWNPDPTIFIETSAVTSAIGTGVDFVREFGLESKRFTGFRFSLGRNHKFRLSYVPVRYDADAVLERTLTFNSQTFIVGAPAATDIKWDLWTFGYEWDFVSNERGFLGVVADLKYNKVDASISSPALTGPAATVQTAPVPTVGVAGRAYLSEAVSVTADFTGLKHTRDEFRAKFFDFDIYSTVTFGPVGVHAGYRSVTVDYLIDADAGDLKLRSPYFGAVVKF
jgi:hypothetical protein